MVKPREILKKVETYKPGKPISEVKRELGLSDIHKLASNENPLGPSPLAMEAVREEISSLNFYPDAGCHALRKKLGEKLGFDMEQIVIGAGSEQLLHYLIDAFVGQGDEIVMPWPSFSIYDINTSLREGVAIKIPLTEDFRLDLPAMAEAVNAKTKIVFVCNPNNPSGTIVRKQELEAFIARVPEDVLIVLDEAYIEYVDRAKVADSLRYLKERENIIVLRTFSKAYGLAGLRVGYGIASVEVAAAIGKVKDSFNVHNLAQAAAFAAIDDKVHLMKTIAANNVAKAYICAELDKMGLRYADSETNFILFEIKEDSGKVFEGMLRRGIIVRPGHLLGHPGFLRVSTGAPDENELFIKSLREVLAEV